MGRSRGESDVDDDVVRVSDAMVGERGGKPVRNRLHELVLWLLVDVPRWITIVGLAATVYLTTMVVGVFGPVSVDQYLISGTPISDAYIELQPGLITAITIVLAINQLVLSPEFGRLGRQRNRLNDVLSHRHDVEETADVIGSPTDPSGFLRTIVDAVREHAHELESGTAQDSEVGRRVRELFDGMDDDLSPVGDGLERRPFGSIEMLGAAMHLETAPYIHELHEFKRMYRESLSGDQLRTLDDLEEALEDYIIAREYFRTLYLQVQFIKFSKAMLLTGLPALVVAHYAIGLIGPEAMTGSTLGVRNLLWFESGTFAVAMLPVVVIVSYVARIVTLGETSIFISPFSPEHGE